MYYWMPRPKPPTAEDLPFVRRHERELTSSRYDSLSDRAQARLHYAAVRGHMGARERLWASWRRWSYSVAKHYFGLAPAADLVQAADAALWQAIDTWDPEGGAKLGRWAVLPMRRDLRHVVADSKPGYRPSIARMMDDDMPMAVGLEVIVDAGECAYDDPDVVAAATDDSVDIESEIEASSRIETLRTIVSETLPTDELHVVSRACGLEDGVQRPLAEVARELGVSRGRVRSLYTRGLKRLQQGPYAATLQALWEDL